MGKTLIYTEEMFLLSLIHSNFLKFCFFSFFRGFFSSQLQEMLKRIAITLCRVFITQQKISTSLSAQTYLCDICVFFNSFFNWESFLLCVCMCVFVVCVCVCVCFYFVSDALQTTPLHEIP